MYNAENHKVLNHSTLEYILCLVKYCWSNILYSKSKLLLWMHTVPMERKARIVLPGWVVLEPEDEPDGVSGLGGRGSVTGQLSHAPHHAPHLLLRSWNTRTQVNKTWCVVQKTVISTFLFVAERANLWKILLLMSKFKNIYQYWVNLFVKFCENTKLEVNIEIQVFIYTILVRGLYCITCHRIKDDKMENSIKGIWIWHCAFAT